MQNDMLLNHIKKSFAPELLYTAFEKSFCDEVPVEIGIKSGDVTYKCKVEVFKIKDE